WGGAGFSYFTGWLSSRLCGLLILLRLIGLVRLFSRVLVLGRCFLAVLLRLVVSVQINDESAASAVLAAVAERYHQPLSQSRTSHLHQAKRRDLRDLMLGPVTPETLGQPPQHQVPVAFQDHVDEVDDDNAAEVAQPQLPHDLLSSFQVI